MADRRHAGLTGRRCQLMIAVLVVLVVLVVPALIGCSNSGGYLEELLKLESGGYRAEAPDQDRVRELESQIAEYRDRVEQAVRDAGQLAVYYKMLGVALMDQRMFALAVEPFSQAVQLQPTNQILFYYLAVCHGQMAQATPDRTTRDNRLERATWHYQRALELDPRYVDALYGYAVLAVYELDEPQRAIELIGQLEMVERNNIEARFVKAAAFVQVERISDAIAVYREIETMTSDPEVRGHAAINRQALEGTVSR